MPRACDFYLLSPKTARAMCKGAACVSRKQRKPVVLYQRSHGTRPRAFHHRPTHHPTVTPTGHSDRSGGLCFSSSRPSGRAATEWRNPSLFSGQPSPVSGFGDFVSAKARQKEDARESQHGADRPNVPTQHKPAHRKPSSQKKRQQPPVKLHHPAVVSRPKRPRLPIAGPQRAAPPATQARKAQN